jgi:hypothetical protein
VQHNARLNEEPTQVSPLTLQAERRAIQQLWLAVFGGAVLKPGAGWQLTHTTGSLN